MRMPRPLLTVLVHIRGVVEPYVPPSIHGHAVLEMQWSRANKIIHFRSRSQQEANLPVLLLIIKRARGQTSIDCRVRLRALSLVPCVRRGRGSAHCWPLALVPLYGKYLPVRDSLWALSGTAASLGRPTQARSTPNSNSFHYSHQKTKHTNTQQRSHSGF